MDADQLSRWLTLGANIGVIAGIVFLGLELRQNADLMRAQWRAEMSRDTVNLLSLNVNDPSYIDVLGRGLRGEELTGVENSQFRRTYNAFIWHWNNLEYQHRVGLYPESEYRLQTRHLSEERLAQIDSTHGRPPGKRVGCTAKTLRGRPRRRLVDFLT